VDGVGISSFMLRALPVSAAVGEVTEEVMDVDEEVDDEEEDEDEEEDKDEEEDMDKNSAEVIEGVGGAPELKRQQKAAHVECRCSHTEALRVNPRLPNGGSRQCTPSSSRSLTAVVIEGLGRGPV